MPVVGELLERVAAEQYIGAEADMALTSADDGVQRHSQGSDRSMLPVSYTPDPSVLGPLLATGLEVAKASGTTCGGSTMRPRLYLRAWAYYLRFEPTKLMRRPKVSFLPLLCRTSTTMAFPFPVPALARVEQPGRLV
jgi:hypothetical protein